MAASRALTWRNCHGNSKDVFRTIWQHYVTGKNSSAFLLHLLHSFRFQQIPRGAKLVSDSLLFNSIIIIALAATNPTALAALTLHSGCLTLGDCWSLRCLLHALAVATNTCRFPQGRTAHRLWADLSGISDSLDLDPTKITGCLHSFLMQKTDQGEADEAPGAQFSRRHWQGLVSTNLKLSDLEIFRIIAGSDFKK